MSKTETIKTLGGDVQIIYRPRGTGYDVFVNASPGRPEPALRVFKSPFTKRWWGCFRIGTQRAPLRPEVSGAKTRRAAVAALILLGQAEGLL